MALDFPFWIAHRGAGKLAPENTLAAFRVGASYGYRAFECDVKLSADGELYLLHDATLGRTTNAPQHWPQGSLNAADHAWPALAELDAGSWHSRAFAGEPLPRLSAIARYVQANGARLNLEIKPIPGTERDTGRAVAAACQQLWAGRADVPLLSSFKPVALQAALQQAPELPRGLLLDALHPDWLQQAQSLECAAVICNYAIWTPELVAQVHALGMQAWSYTVNDEWAAEYLQALGTDAIITDRVDLFSPASLAAP